MNINDLLRDNIKSMNAYASARDEYEATSADLIFLDANENPNPTDVNRYPDPYQTKLKERLSKVKHIKPSQILLGNGSDEALDLIFRAFCEPNQDAVMTLPPTYGMYRVLAQLNAVEVLEIELDSDFQPRVDAVLNAQTQNSKLLFICSPNNPTANSIYADKVEKLIREFNGIVVIDEAYIDFSKQESWLNRLNEFQNLIVTQTFSKAYGMAGIRLGMCFASELIIKVLNKIKPPYNVNQLSQQAAFDRLKNLGKVKREISTIIQQRQLLQDALENISCIEKVYASDANFILAKVDNANQRYAQLIANQIVVRNRTTQALCDNCLRFTIGTEEENKTLIKILKQLS